MRVQDITAELLSEIAEELGFVVISYESGRISFISDKKSSNNDSINQRLKVICYQEDMVFLWAMLEFEEVNLHDPDSIDKIKEYFKDSSRHLNKTPPIPPGNISITSPTISPAVTPTISIGSSSTTTTSISTTTSIQIDNTASNTTNFLNLNNSLTSDHFYLDPGGSNEFSTLDDSSIFSFSSFGSLCDVQF